MQYYCFKYFNLIFMKLSHAWQSVRRVQSDLHWHFRSATKFCPAAHPVVTHPVSGACNKCLAGRKFIDGKLGFKVNYDKFVAGFLFIASHGESTALVGQQRAERREGRGVREPGKINVCKLRNEPEKEREWKGSMSKFNCPVVWLIEKSQVFRPRK